MVGKIAVIIPAHNEEKVLHETIASLLKNVPKKDIYIVSDGSKDKTAKIARKYLKNVLDFKLNKGKAKALSEGIKYFKLIEKYDYIFPLDADTRMDPLFIKNILAIFEKDTHKKIAAVVGKVVGSTRSAVTSYRLWEYEISQSIHKRAQGILGTITVCAGCATVYRSTVFNYVEFPSGTLTEDMDLTFMIYINKLGKIVFCNTALVYTQDPLTIKDLCKQLNRWYTGFWQCVAKHKIPLNKRFFELEIALSATDGLMNSVISLLFVLMFPFLFLQHTDWLIMVLGIDFLFLLLPGVMLCVIKYHAWKMIRYLPHFYLLRIISSWLFIYAFFKVAFGFDRSMGWNSLQRYAYSKDRIGAYV